MNWAITNRVDGLRALPPRPLITGAGRRPSLASAVAGSVLNFLFGVLRCRRAAISPLTALMLIPISGAMAYSIELGGWYYTQRSMQNAADSAAIAAATVSSTGANTTPLMEARAAAKQFGFVDGVKNTTVTAATTTCPAGVAAGATCYKATVSTVFPLLFSRVIGLNGDTALGTARGQLIQSAAIATTSGPGTALKTPCVTARSTSTTAFVSNGGPKPDMSGCTLLSYGGMTCNGHDLGADYGVAAGTSSGCGAHQVSGATMPPDPYDTLKSNVDPFACGDTPADNTISGGLSGTLNYCGNVKLTSDVTLTGANTVMTIKNGVLDLNGFTLKTPSATDGATIVFSGSNTSPRSHIPMSSVNKAGTIDIKAPTSGNWSGVAIYQDPKLTSNVSLTYAGNQPTWNITGLVYMPNADLQFSGAVNKSAAGASCFVLVAYTVLVNGTAYIYADASGCSDAGLTTPGVTVTTGTIRERLVS